MPTKFKSPYASAFKTGVKNGTPCTMIVNSICKRTGKPAPTIWQSLYKAGCCYRQKFNGQWIYWPTFRGKKSSTKNCNWCHTNMWQCFVDWCLCCGWCTPVQLNNNSTSQKTFMNFCTKYWNKQSWSAGATKTKTSSKSKTKSWKSSKPKMKKRVSKRHPSTWGRSTSFKFPTMSKSRRFVKAA